LRTLFENSTNSNYDSFVQNRKGDYIAIVEIWNNQFKEVLEKIETLLPNAMTAGLSHAYSEKKNDEAEERKWHSITFNVAICGMVIVSLIPFWVSIRSLLDKTSLHDVILDLPRLVLSILPLYVPVLWVAYSSNRKMNLSKRLIEEYSHKEVLSKTYEGLSTQINNIPDKEASSDLRIKLLYNILEISSENPGKLISNYNKSDHPLMDALDKSVQLSNAVAKLSNFPGMTRISEFMENKSKNLVEENAKKVADGLDKLKAG
jgi:hypothetical protein